MTILDIEHAGKPHYDSACSGKRRCESMEEAKRGARQMHKIFHKQFSAYRCVWCGGFHVGSRKKRAA